MKIKDINTKLVLTGVATFCLSSFTAPVFAQVDQETSYEIEEIIVTARKRSQSIQDTPLAISAFDSQELKSAAYDNIVDVSKAAPGLFIETVNQLPARVETTPRFRGITFDAISPLQRTASIFIDGVIVSGGIQSIGVQELERVEVIKGPQSALFGRNTFSGAINYITKTPTEESSTDVSIDIASRDEVKIGLSTEGKFAENLSGRIFFNYSDKEGHYDNQSVLALPEGQTLGDEESQSIGAVLNFTPSDKVQIKVRGTYYEDNDGPAAVIRTAGFEQHNFGGFPLPGGGTTETAFQGTVQTPTGSQIGLNTSQATFDRITAIALNDDRPVSFLGLDFDDLGGFGLVREGYRIAVDTSFELSDSLQLDVLAGVNQDEFLFFGDFDGSPDFGDVPPFAGFSATAGGPSILGFNNRFGRETEDTSIEARLSGSTSNSRLNWSIGANYVDIETSSIGGFYDGIRNVYFDGIFEDPILVTTAETFGIFGSLDYKLNDKVTLILEGRYQEDEITDEQVNNGVATFDDFLPRALVQYQPNENTLLYASYSVGNLPGGFNPEVADLDAQQLAEFESLVPGAGIAFGEETLTNLEFGWKQSLFDGRLAFNFAAFLMEREDQIFSGFELVSDTAPNAPNPFRTVAFTDNGATTDIMGFELDGTWNATRALSFQASVGYTDAEIDSFPTGANAGDFTSVFGPDANVSGQRAPRFPEWTGSLSGSYELPVSVSGSDGSWYFRGDVFYTGDFFDENTNLAVLPSATDVNIRTGLRFDKLTLELYVTNLFEEDAPIAGNNLADTGGSVRTRTGLTGFAAFGGLFDFSQESVHVALRDRRQIGVRASYSF